MKYMSTVIAVKDINAAKNFYQDLFMLDVFQDYGINVSFTCGIALQQEFDWMLSIPKDQIFHKANNMELYFEEDNFDEFLKKIEAYKELEYVTQPKTASWGQRSVRFYDLDYHIIEVGESMKIVVQRFLDSGLTLEETSKTMDVSVDDLQKILNS